MLDAPTIFTAPYLLSGAPQACQIFSTWDKRTIVCSGQVKNGLHFLRYWGLSYVMHSHCHSVTLGTWSDLDLEPYLHKLTLIWLLYITFLTILTVFMRWATQHKVSGLYISQTLILNFWPDLDLARDLKIQIETYYHKCLITSFRLPPRPRRCGYWFSSYQLGDV